MCAEISDYLIFGSGFAVIFTIIALIIYPLCFAGELQYGNRNLWEFGYAYGVAWGAVIFLFGGIVLLLVDKEPDEMCRKDSAIGYDASSAGRSENYSSTKA